MGPNTAAGHWTQIFVALSEPETPRCHDHRAASPHFSRGASGWMHLGESTYLHLVSQRNCFTLLESMKGSDTLYACYGTLVKSVKSFQSKALKTHKKHLSFFFALWYIFTKFSYPSALVVVHHSDSHHGIVVLFNSFFHGFKGTFCRFPLMHSHHTCCMLTAHTDMNKKKYWKSHTIPCSCIFPQPLRGRVLVTVTLKGMNKYSYGSVAPRPERQTG